MDFDYWEQVETVPSDSFYNKTKPQSQQTTFIVHSTAGTSKIETNCEATNNFDFNEYSEIDSSMGKDTTLRPIKSNNSIKNIKNGQQQRPPVVVLPSQSNVSSKTTKIVRCDLIFENFLFN